MEWGWFPTEFKESMKTALNEAELRMIGDLEPGGHPRHRREPAGTDVAEETIHWEHVLVPPPGVVPVVHMSESGMSHSARPEVGIQIHRRTRRYLQ